MTAMGSLRVLFVDDEEELVSAVVERLRIRGIDARGATTGAEALALIDRETFDVAAVDVKMPGLGGLEVVRRVKREHPGLQVILLSGHGSRDDAVEGKRLGAFDYVEKPINIDILIDILRAAAAATDQVGP
jgi:DNA-binding NtrC family response regulator